MATVRVTLNKEYADATGERSAIKEFNNIVSTPEVLENGALRFISRSSPTRVKLIAPGAWHDCDYPLEFSGAGVETADMAGARR